MFSHSRIHPILFLIISILFCYARSIHQISSRKAFVRATSITFAAIWMDLSEVVLADVGPNDIKCTMTVKNSAEVPKGTDSAIYLTAREDVGIWTAQIKNVKPPPILSSRTPGAFTFPVEIILSAANDITPEGLEIAKQWQSGAKPIVISARLDSDGVAATRNSEDLVGKSISSKSSDGEWKGCQIELTDRGFGGKMITKKR